MCASLGTYLYSQCSQDSFHFPAVALHYLMSSLPFCSPKRPSRFKEQTATGRINMLHTRPLIHSISLHFITECQKSSICISVTGFSFVFSVFVAVATYDPFHCKHNKGEKMERDRIIKEKQRRELSCFLISFSAFREFKYEEACDCSPPLFLPSIFLVVDLISDICVQVPMKLPL